MPDALFKIIVVALLVGNAALTIYAHLEKKMTDAEVAAKLDAIRASQQATNASLTEAIEDIGELKTLGEEQVALIADLRAQLENDGMSSETAEKLAAVEAGQVEIDAKAAELAAVVPEPTPET